MRGIVVRHEDAPKIGMTQELHAHEVVDLALFELRAVADSMTGAALSKATFTSSFTFSSIS